jgi:hypothetical protein
VLQPVFGSFINSLLPQSLFTATAEIDHLAHAMTRSAGAPATRGYNQKTLSDLLCRYHGTDNTHFNLVRPQ